jgi:hypothetical protein
MEKGICTRCGIIVTLPHECDADKARLVEIDREVIRTMREILLAEGKKGFGNKLETLENEAKAIRNKGK